MSAESLHLRTDKLIETAEKLAGRVGFEFPQAGLGEVARTIADVVRNAVDRAEKIARPNWWLRGGLIGLAGVVLALTAVGVTVVLRAPDRFADRFMDLMRTASGAAFALSAVVVFLVTLETRLKRSRALEAIMELRSLAHIIDMHQLSKDPDAPVGSSGATYTRAELLRYLRYCTEMLALVSKVGQLYVEDFSDGTTLAAVDQCENLATGLSQKIWQKIMILEDEDCKPAAPSPAPGPPPSTP
jgi:hypothetical protein